jgi:hypothetical protein
MPLPHDMPIATVATNVAHVYGVVVRNPGQLLPIQQISRATLNVAYDAALQFGLMLNRQTNLLLNFLRGLDAAGATADARLQAITRLNAVFGCNISVLPVTATPARWLDFAMACDTAGAPAWPLLAAFFGRCARGTALVATEEIYHTANSVGLGAQALTVMRTVMLHNGEPNGVTPASIVRLIRMLAAFPPMNGFAGFARWGPGDSGDNSPVTNVDKHTLKHVCRKPIDVEFGISETMAWWAALNVSLTLTDYQTHANVPIPGIEVCFDPVAPLAGARLQRFLVYQAFNDEPALTQFVKNQALVPYQNFAIQNSAGMNHVIVHSDGENVYISGAHGDSFIIGRYQGIVLGISSCYKPLDLARKLAGARNNLAWPLV